MFEKTIMLRSFEDVKKFVDIASSKSYEVDLISGKYVVNAKSIMGVFSLDLTKPLVVKAYCENNAEIARQLEPFSKEQRSK